MRNDAPQALQEKPTIETRDVRQSKVAELQQMIRRESDDLVELSSNCRVDNPVKARFILDNPGETIAIVLFVLFVLWIIKA